MLLLKQSKFERYYNSCLDRTSHDPLPHLLSYPTTLCLESLKLRLCDVFAFNASNFLNFEFEVVSGFLPKGSIYL